MKSAVEAAVEAVDGDGAVEAFVFAVELRLNGMPITSPTAAAVTRTNNGMDVGGYAAAASRDGIDTTAPRDVPMATVSASTVYVPPPSTVVEVVGADVPPKSVETPSNDVYTAYMSSESASHGHVPSTTPPTMADVKGGVSPGTA